jgi:uncharacterized membrane protein
MSKQRRSLVIALVLQVMAVLVYPLSFFEGAPQAAVLPPSLLILMVLGLVGMNTGTLAPTLGRTFLVFVQGVNIVVRMMMLFPNLRSATGEWNFILLITQLLGMTLSWYAISAMESLHPSSLRFTQSQTREG